MKQRKREGERVLVGAEALAWLAATVEATDVYGHKYTRSVNSVFGKRGARGWARYRVERGWSLVVNPSSLANHGEWSKAVACPQCGHRLQPNQTARIMDHEAKHRREVWDARIAAGLPPVEEDE